MKILPIRLLVCATLSAAAPTASSQSAQDEVVVTGQRAAPSPSVQRQHFVDRYAQLSRVHQVVRWRRPICVKVDNMPAEFGDFIAGRVDEVARAAGALVDQESGCRPNVEIMFTPDPQGVLDSVRQDAPVLLGFHYYTHRNEVATMTRPIQAWHVTATSNGTETVIDNPQVPPPAGPAGSRITHGVRTEIVHVLILVDSTKVSGLPVGPIADYVSMLALTQMAVREWNCGELASIIDYFSEPCPGESAPERLTSADIGFLQGLYAMADDQVGPLQRSQIRARMAAADGAR